MTESAVARPRRRDLRPLAQVGVTERWVEGRVALTWGLLVLNVLTFAPNTSVIPIPGSVGKVITQGTLPVALLVALSLNRKVVIRPNVFLCLISLLAIEAIFTAPQGQYLRSTGYRTFRLTEFVIVLWLLTPFWGRRDLLLVRIHLKAMGVVLASVLVGLAIDPPLAMSTGRLHGVVWPMPATQTAHYAAVTIGLVVVLWLCGLRRGRATLLLVAVLMVVLLLTHTRTALVGLVFGLLIAGLSLVVHKARARRTFVAAGVAGAVILLGLSDVITAFLVRGEGSSQLTGLSGRTGFWGPLLAFPRDRFQMIFGFGLSNDTFNGQPIDSNWFVSYQDQGLFGVVMCAVILVFLLVVAYFQPRGVQRALALFLIAYCLVASFTEVGFTSASTYMLDLVVAASLLVPAAARWRPVRE